MGTEDVVLGGVLVSGIGLSVFFIYYCLQRRETRGASSLVVLFVGLSFWMLADLIQLLTPATLLPPVGVQVRVLGPDLGVLGVFLFGLEYTGRDHLITRKTVSVLAVKPLLTLVLTVSQYRSLLLEVAPGSPPTVGYHLVMTPLFTVHTLYDWSLMAVGLGLLAHMMIQSNYGYQRQVVAVWVAILVPFLFNALARTGVVQFDLTSAAFLVTAIIFTYAAFRLRLMDAIPPARQTVLEEMDDMVLVLDENDTVISVNNAVRERLANGTQLLGDPVQEVFDSESLTGIDEDGGEEISVSVAGQTRHYNVSKSTIHDYRENRLAQVLVCRDVTEQRRRERELRRREENLRLLKDLQSRFLRHNLRNELNVVQMNAQYLANEDDPEQQELLDGIIDKTERILDWGTKARTIEQLIEMEDTVHCNLNQQIEHAVTEMREEHPAVKFDVELSKEPWIQAVPQVERAFENLLDNAARYNTSADPSVRISTERTDGNVAVRIEDNGPGIDQGEIDTILGGEETKLNHSSGFGLWLVYWVIEKSGGDVTFETDDGTTVVLTFERATPPEDEKEVLSG